MAVEAVGVAEAAEAMGVVAVVEVVQAVVVGDTGLATCYYQYKGRLSKLTNDTEQNLLVPAPGAFWDQTLKPKLLQLLAKKTPRNKCHEPDETNVVVSITDRSQRDLTKRFDELDIDWGAIENQLVAWSHQE
ncbi:hypothetical protein B0T14DRAFT_493284 [Immersiella caudata]|uniref:Uncharacterized protein n=1 Tax=Immersiella caudata TaxID=314043 RepID=A0AA39X4Q2_9PEZI|nr:hypothetical protein B0T14DRAFT_493284 [Immersiella caudata]